MGCRGAGGEAYHMTLKISSTGVKFQGGPRRTFGSHETPDYSFCLALSSSEITPDRVLRVRRHRRRVRGSCEISPTDIWPPLSGTDGGDFRTGDVSNPFIRLRRRSRDLPPAWPRPFYIPKYPESAPVVFVYCKQPLQNLHAPPAAHVGAKHAVTLLHCLYLLF